jgi:probable F420-dependent oxidoreductase
MKVDAPLTTDLATAPEVARSLEDAGYAGAWTAEIANDPFLPLLRAAEDTRRLELGTSIAVAFARNPMLVANIGNDLQRFSEGRFILGLGSQIKPHITKRFSMPWSHPAARMREFIAATRAIWASWQDGTRLDFRGDFYTHTLMTPMFDPGPNPFGPPRVYLAGVGELMTEVAGEVCDGFFCHGFTTERYLREVTIPALDRGLARSGRTRADLEISGPAFVVTGTTEEEMATSAAATRSQISFYGSTPAYRAVLELHGWGDLQDELNLLSKQGRWSDMGGLIDDEILDTFAVVAEPGRVAEGLRARYGDVIDRIMFYAPYRSDPDTWLPVLADLSSGTGGTGRSAAGRSG